MPNFCTHCKSIGHNNCHWLHPQKQVKMVKEGATIDKGKKALQSLKQVTTQLVAVENPSAIGSSKAFAATAGADEKQNEITIITRLNNSFCPLTFTKLRFWPLKRKKLQNRPLSFATVEVLAPQSQFLI